MATFGGALKTADGTSKMAQLQEAGSVDISSAAALPFGAATIMMAVALHSIEQKLDRIEKMQKQIFDFLTTEKESEIEADVQILFGILAQYKFNWDNGHYTAISHKMVLDIKRTSLKNVRAYQKIVTGEIEKQLLFALRNDVDSALANLMNQFKYYRMSIFVCAFSSLAEIMLGGNFKEEYIAAVGAEIEELAADYCGFFEKASQRLEKLSSDALDTTILKGIGRAGKSVGKFFGNIPGIRNTSVDKFLQESGDGLVDKASVIEEKAVRRFADLGNPCTSHIAELMQNMTAILTIRNAFVLMRIIFTLCGNRGG